MVRRHLESDGIFKEDIEIYSLSECIFRLIAKVSRNMSPHHTCSWFIKIQKGEEA